MATTEKYRAAEEMAARIRALEACPGWTELVLPKIRSEMEKHFDKVMDERFKPEEVEASRGAWRALKEVLDMIQRQKSISANIIASDPLLGMGQGRA